MAARVRLRPGAPLIQTALKHALDKRVFALLERQPHENLLHKKIFRVQIRLEIAHLLVCFLLVRLLAVETLINGWAALHGQDSLELRQTIVQHADEAFSEHGVHLALAAICDDRVSQLIHCQPAHI